ncbi:MAG: nicotinate-nucleotide adenylyltransferase [Gammaproteobacteria bacterium]|nr:nicotinate-nucleotide adenylyltransferase [Gammaproteobacteria bacterium]NNF62026.1 nicotinate-nucleotide adenylyltransferase [Gammaproteobacteria bacterium]NNM19896.1 nicotinate-nucleotide adenylyltransferase [Gammaproteobacteria bacterium]
MSPIGVFGGTFDPIHYGHLRTAHELQRALQLSEVRFLPCGLPPHREPAIATGEQRVAMVRAAVSDERRFIVDDRELHRDGPSYSVDTLLALRAEFPTRSLCLMVGMDAYLGLPKWYQWRQILQLAHLVVAHRPGWVAPDTGPLGELLADRGTQDIDDLHRARAGRIFIHAVTQLEISSSAVREMISAGDDPRYLMPDAVRDLILETKCYQLEAEQTA